MKSKKINHILLFGLFAVCMVFTFSNKKNSADLQNIKIYNLPQLNVNTEHVLCNNPNATIKLPSSLITIEDSAFDGTTITNIVFPDSLTTIGNNAFSNIQTLRKIVIPATTTYIGKDAFKGSTQVTITAAPRSYARAYAQQNKIPFNPVESFYAYNKTIQIIGLSNSRAELQELILEGETADNQKANQTGRMTGDLNADRYETITAFHIQGRSPPMG